MFQLYEIEEVYVMPWNITNAAPVSKQLELVTF